MEQVMGQIEQDILYGDAPVAGKPTPGAKPPAKAAPPPPPPKPTPVEVVRNFLKRQAGPLPVWGWGSIGVGAVALTGIVIGVCRHRRDY